MSRAAFNTTCDIINGPLRPAPGAIRIANAPCRIVKKSRVVPYGIAGPVYKGWITLDQGALVDGMNAALKVWKGGYGDRVAVPSGAANTYWIPWAVLVTPYSGPPYWRGELFGFPAYP